MDKIEYRAKKESGELVTDAALQEEKPVAEEPKEETEPEITDEEQEKELEDDPVIEDEDDLPPLNEKEKTAFEKRMERERSKAEEKIRAELEQTYGNVSIVCGYSEVEI